MTKIYIYAIYFFKSKKYYIGQTKYLNKRLQSHLCSGSLVCKALWKYDDWQVSILHTCKTRDEANRIEIEEIRNFNSVAPNGYNLTRGGDGLSDPTGEIAKKISIALIGKKESKETCQKKSIAMLGNKNGQGGKGKEKKKGAKKPGTSIAMKGTRHAQGTKRFDLVQRNKSLNSRIARKRRDIIRLEKEIESGS